MICGWFYWSFFGYVFLVGRLIDGVDLVQWSCRDAGKSCMRPLSRQLTDSIFSIVEYATRDQAQNAINTLSNQTLMGRLVYVREVSKLITYCATIDDFLGP